MITNADFGNTRGVRHPARPPHRQLFNGTLAYTFSDAKNTGSDPFTYINFGSRVVNQLSGGNQPPPQALPPTDLHPAAQPGRLVRAHVPERVERRAPRSARSSRTSASSPPSGSPAARPTPAARSETRQRVGRSRRQRLRPEQFAGDLNGARLPTLQAVRPALHQGLRLGGWTSRPYLDARNIFNFTQRRHQVFAETNDIVNAVEQQEPSVRRLGRYADEACPNGV